MKTEIEFLAELLLTFNLDKDTTNVVLKRIIELQQQPVVTINQPFISDLCQHEYPNPWWGTIPPACKKCGQMSAPYIITSLSSGVTINEK